MAAILNVVGSFSAKQMLMQKMAAVWPSTLRCLVVQGNGILSVEYGAHSLSQSTELSFLHCHSLVHLNGRNHRVLRDEREKLDVQLEIKQLVEVELLHLPLLVDRVQSRLLWENSGGAVLAEQMGHSLGISAGEIIEDMSNLGVASDLMVFENFAAIQGTSSISSSTCAGRVSATWRGSRESVSVQEKYTKPKSP